MQYEEININKYMQIIVSFIPITFYKDVFAYILTTVWSFNSFFSANQINQIKMMIIVIIC